MQGFRRAIAGAALLFTFVFAASAGAAQLTPLATSAQWSSTPIYAASPPGDARLFVAESGRSGSGCTTGTGAVRVIKSGTLLATPYLTIPVSCDGERGLTSFAFAPDFATSGKLYLFVATGGLLKVVEYATPSPSSDTVGAAATRDLISIPDTDPYHNGGQLMFGPDGMLYLTVGDDNDTTSAQSAGSPNGKILKISPSAALNNYSVVALGFRNPWRASFDPAGRLIAADVGQSDREEIDIVTAGANYGWPLCEGDRNYAGSCSGYSAPFYTYAHDSTHKSIIGGYVARDAGLTGITGCYVFGDLAKKTIDMVDVSSPGAKPVATGLSVNNAFSLWSFGEDSAGHLYVMADGTVYRVDAGGTAPATCLVPKGTSGATAAARLRIQTPKLNASRKQRVKIRFHCVGPADCTGGVTVRSRSRLKISGKRRSVVFLSTSVGTIKAGTSKTKTFKLRKLGRRALATRRSVKVKITTRSVKSGLSTTIATRSATLRR